MQLFVARVCGGRHPARRGGVARRSATRCSNAGGACSGACRGKACSSKRSLAALRNWWLIGTRVIDPDTKQPRPVRFGDIAVLARTKQHVEEIARALKTARVPMKMSLAGLFKVPEVCLARACLRRLADPADTLASAEIVAFADCDAPELWLADRLRHLGSEGAVATIGSTRRTPS